jgi:diacylglycerol kinase family enzyme
VSGKAVNLRPLIEKRLILEKISFEFRPTKKQFDPYYFAKEIDLSQYSLLVAAGGDGTHHEVVNGMLARADGVKLPFAPIPNGSGNDFCRSIGVLNLDQALDYIANAEVVGVDTVRCLLDFNDVSEIKTDKEMLEKCRHMLTNCSISMPARVVQEARKYKKCCGMQCYAIATMQEAILGRVV